MKVMQDADKSGAAFPVFAPDSSKFPEVLNEGMTLIDYFAAHETLADFDQTNACMSKSDAEKLAGSPRPEAGPDCADPLAIYRWEAKWRAALRYLRAEAMVERRAKA